MAEYNGGPGITRFRAEYFHQDHLGNTRLGFSDFNQNGRIDLEEEDPATPLNELEVTQESHYYPFGMNHDGPWYATVAPENKYLYNGKELSADYEINLYEYGARWYGPAVGRFTGVDPLAEKAPSWTPYRYAFDNPLIFLDPDGMFEDRDAAKQYAKDNEIKTGLFRRNKIREQSDGTYAIENEREKTAISDLGGDLGVMAATMVSPTDVMDSRVVSDGNPWTSGDIRFEHALRDGSVVDGGPAIETGTAPVGVGRFKKILKAAKIFDKISKRYRNRDGKLPKRDANGNRITYRKADIDRNPSPAQRANGATRSSRRLIKGSDGKYYYTHDHYKTFSEIKVPKQ